MLIIHLEEVLKFLKSKFSKGPDSIKQVIIYGPVARGDYRPDSDLDIAVIYENELREVKKFAERVADEIYLEFSIPQQLFTYLR